MAKRKRSGGHGSSKRRRTIRRRRTTMRGQATGNMARRTSWAPLPKSKKFNFRYVTQVTINPGIAVSGRHAFAANGLFDPDVTGAGHQPYGFDQMMALYNHYTVIGAKIKVTGENSQSDVKICGIQLTPDNLAVPSVQDIMERPGQTWKFIGEQQGGTSAINIAKGFSARKFFGKRNIVGSADYRGDAASNPNELAFFLVWMGPQDGSDLAGQIFTVEISYFAVLTEPKLLPSS